MTSVSEQLSQASVRWRAAMEETRFRVEWVVTLLTVVLLFTAAPPYLQFIQHRAGLAINDPVLNALPGVDMSIWIFFLLYSCVAIILLHICQYPWQFLRGGQTYVLMTIIRLGCLYLVPLEAPKGLIYLDDPFLNFAFYQGYVTKDLFFSGHVATMFLFGVVSQNRKLKHFFYFNTLVLSVMILLQKFHYTADVIAAPFFVWGTYKIIQKLAQKLDERFGKPASGSTV